MNEIVCSYRFGDKLVKQTFPIFQGKAFVPAKLSRNGNKTTEIDYLSFNGGSRYELTTAAANQAFVRMVVPTLNLG